MITVQIASIPDREVHLELTINSLIDQCDHMFVALNNYDHVPTYIEGNPKISYQLMDNTLGDGAKFLNTDKLDGYILTCDDDLTYNEGYVDLMIKGLENHGGIVTILGKRYTTRPIISFGRGYSRLFSCLLSVKGDHVVDVAGTGVMAWHSDTIKIDPFLFPRRNMADVWVAQLAHEQGVKITVLGHGRNIVRYKMHSWRIWAKDRDDRLATEVVNSFLK